MQREVEAIPVEQHTEGLTSPWKRIRIIVEFKELEQVAIIEVLHKVLLVIIARVATTTSSSGSSLRGLNCLEIDPPLEDLPPVDLLLDTTNGHQPVNNDISFLTDPAHSIDGLVVVGWIPIGVQYHNAVRPSEVEPEASHFSRQETAEYAWICVELLTQRLSARDLSVAINPQVLKIFLELITARPYDVLDQVQHLLAHGEDQQPVALVLEVPHQSKEKLAL